MDRPLKLATRKLYEKQAELCSALASPVRLQILDVLSERECTSTELLALLEIPKANLSQHLSVLREAGIVATRRAGQYQVLSLALPRIREACAMVKAVLREKLDSDERASAELKRELTRTASLRPSRPKAGR